MLASALILALATATPAAAPLEGWEWRVGPEADAPAASWAHAQVPWVEVGTGEPVVLWLRARLPEGEGDPAGLALLIGYQWKPFDVLLGDRLLYRYPGSTRESPWHLVDLPPGARGQLVTVRMETLADSLGYQGLPFGVRVGSRAAHYLWMLREEWMPIGLGFAFLAVGVVALATAAAAQLQRQSRPYGALALMCFVNALWLFPSKAGYVTALLFPRQDILDFVALTMGHLVPAAQVWFIRSIYGRPLRFGLPWVAWLTAACGVATGLGFFTGLFIMRSAVCQVMTLTLCALVLANIAVAWRRCSRPLRLVSLGLIVCEVCSLVDALGYWFDATPLLGLGDAAFAAFLCFVLLSLIVVGVETRAREDKERERHGQLEAVARTTAMFAHDVRKPFALMRLTLQGLREAAAAPQMREPLELAAREIDAASHSVEEMISDILEAGSDARLQVASTELRELLAVTFSRLSRAGDARDVALRFTLQHTRQLAVHRSKVERLLSNLLCNALESMHGAGLIWVHARDVVSRGRRFVEICVGNAGPPIPEEKLARVFDPFFTDGKRGGTGLGLTIVKKVVDAHGGAIACRSGAQTGVEFTFTLPASELPADPGVALPSRLGGGVRAAPSAPVSGLAKIVLVEDSHAIRQAWSRQLGAGTVLEFGSPTECLAAAGADPSFLVNARFVILDNRFQPGEMDGVRLGHLLRARTRAPILLCSGVALSPLPDCFDGQLLKDAFSLESLQEAVAECARRREVA